MNPTRKILPLTLILLIATLFLGQFANAQTTVEPSISDLENKSYNILTAAYNLNLTHYNITLDQIYELPQIPNDSQICQSVDYMLNSPDSNLVATFVYKDGDLYQCALRTINGTVFQTQKFPNMTAAAADFLTQYQTVNSVDLTPLIRMLSMLNQTGTRNTTLGTITLGAGGFQVVPGHYNSGFTWLNKADQACISLDFDNDVFYNFIDLPPFTVADMAQAAALLKATPTPTITPSPVTANQSASSPAVAPQQESETPTAPKSGILSSNLVIVALSVVIVICICVMVYIKIHSERSSPHSAPNCGVGFA